MTKCQTLTVKLRRPSRKVPWGISIAGGSDLDTPLIVTRSENEDLQKGDVIKKIDEYDVRDLRHVDAQNLLKNSEFVKLAIERMKGAHMTTPVLPKSPIPPPLALEDTDYTSSLLPSSQYAPVRDHYDEVREERYYLSQPYRTTPLVLPGAKIKKDTPINECYLRHHPNPMVRASPRQYEFLSPEVAMKQKVAESVLQRCVSPNDLPKVVPMQFNSPVGLYSEQNIADTLRGQASAIPKKPGKFDPNISEAYKALQEEGYDNYEQRFSQPTRQGYFSPPNRGRQNRPTAFRPKSPVVNVVDSDGDPIHQSNSFRRVMYSVLGETDY
ncbi:PREDICTED: PDZ and LIM domain protein 3 isoform X3 [Ceratosolen solmsi marchali]|uniref:PDZ and LIM domain protein 3 isoform X3 n=1 Tax=Ceratosolen solmsi marchali TaxID=326594 RepID=A0AAJ7DW74_9HYME|nr:PREDICTED: PDZ and LIM domain protein 3 isoform X3 [Ceratosolen solmsi marchali]